MDEEVEEDVEDGDKSQHNIVAPEYKRLIAIHAGKPKGGLDEHLRVDPDHKVRRHSMSELKFEKAAVTHGKQIVRFNKEFGKFHFEN